LRRSEKDAEEKTLAFRRVYKSLGTPKPRAWLKAK
jgi:hypothetical protein